MRERAFRFWSDTNQQQFEQALDRAGARHAGGATFDVVLVEADQVDPRWLDDLAREFGATTAEPSTGEPSTETGCRS